MNAISGDRRIEHYFATPGADLSPGEFNDLVRDVATLKISLKRGLFESDRGARRIAKLLVGGRSRQTLRRARVSRSNQLIWKDPFVLFCLDALDTANVGRKVVMFRNPSAIAASFKRLGWRFDIEDLDRRLRMAGVAIPLSPIPSTGSTSVDSALALYVRGYAYALEAKRRIPSLIFVNNESLARRPMELMQNLLPQLRLDPMSRRLEELGATRPQSGSSRAYGKRAHTSRRDLSVVNSYFADVLTPTEIAAIEQNAGDVYDRLKSIELKV